MPPEEENTRYGRFFKVAKKDNQETTVWSWRIAFQPESMSRAYLTAKIKQLEPKVEEKWYTLCPLMAALYSCLDNRLYPEKCSSAQ